MGLIRRPGARAALGALLSLALLGLVRVTSGPPVVPPAREEATSSEWMAEQRGLPSDPGSFARAVEQSRRVRETSAPAAVSRPWSLVGPTTIGGRVVDIAVDPQLLDTVYVAAATGGVWKSTDAGLRFRSVWPDENAQAMGALAAAGDGTLYAGTGEANPGGGSLTYGGTGVYRSVDHGETWEHAGLADLPRIGRIAVHPTKPNRIFVAGTGNLFTAGGARGLYRSRNGGRTWTRVLAGANDTTGAVDVAIDPLRPARMFVAMWDHLREPDLRRYGGRGSGVYRSRDGGTTWKRVKGLPADANVGRIGLAVAPGVAYAVVMDRDGGVRGFYRSIDGGSQWIPAATDTVLRQAVGSAGSWFGRVWVDPLDPLHVFTAGVQLAESFDGGTTWTLQPTTLANVPVHVDQHAMAWDPHLPARAYLGNDGGVFRSEASGAAGSWLEAIYQPFAQFYSVDVGEQDPSRVVGGTQDQGSLRSYGEQPVPPLTDGWNEYHGGDGEKTLINYVDHNLVYACLQYGSCSRSEDGGQTMLSMDAFSTRWNWFTPVEFDPLDPSIMYMGGDYLNKSFDAGRTWFPISEDLSIDPGRDPFYPFGTLTTIAPAPDATGFLYLGTDEGRILIHRPGEGFVEATDPDLPRRWVTRVTVDPSDHLTAYATLSGFRAGSEAAHVFRTTDGGLDWQDISGNLPNAPANDVIVVGDLLYVATDVGVFTGGRDGSVPLWSSVGTGLPMTPVTDLRYHLASDRLFAATYGRGIFVLDLGS